ncbi:hypothetical protein BEN71_18240 [Acinetobacter wuhouensis]|uniref:hypothetical protein n=1 Tax=Acinetobacter TaxID=469 RepID=UPI000A32CD49|nr:MULTISPECIES: hypothetical protein [Acinetobacter]AXQ24178.1 hypothetical protein BEN71_18240 [Acinetobacter wuhouensis]RZG75908.1 hypothetical protein EXU29_00375 [Acinetobacter wuhouensis]RZG76917.1 hypothetical protein EXE09_05585 [Acinetobacter sp. WCHAc060025]RZG84502.1 hypothetical protein EXE10_09745 [Acinetobacter sp. WCHAc060033]
MSSLKMNAVKLATATIATLVLSACATTVKPTYVSPTQYQAMNCAQISAEFNRIQQYINNGVTPAKRTGVGVGLGLGGGWGSGGFGWGIGPSISVNMGQSSNTKNTELSRLYGEQDALSQAAQFKNCPYVPKRQEVKK